MPLRRLDGRLQGSIEDCGSARVSSVSASRGAAPPRRTKHDDLVVDNRPRAGYDSTDDHDVGPTADQRRRRAARCGVGRARTEDPLVVSRQESDGRRRGRRGQVLEILAQDLGGLPVDVDRRQTVTEGSDPRLDPLAARAQALPSQ